MSWSESDPLNPQEMQSEVSHLQEELQGRDQLIEQLSQELFRLAKGNPNFVPEPGGCETHQAQILLILFLQEELQKVEQQVMLEQDQIIIRDAEIEQLWQSVQELIARNQRLEQVVQELPQMYRQKFAERMEPVRERVKQLQQENRQLRTEVQGVSYRTSETDEPDLTQEGSDSGSTFRNV